MMVHVNTLRFVSLALIASLVACSSSDDSSTPTPPPSNDGGGGTTPPPPGSADGIDETALAACPQSSTLIETKDWPACLTGRRVAGAEPFSNTPCELRFGPNNSFEYYRSGAVAMKVPEKSAWGGSASGLYQNELASGYRFFLAGISPDLAAVPGEARITNIDLKFFSVSSSDDTIEIEYLDAASNRQTYNCTVKVL